MFLKELSSNGIISTLLYCLSIEQFLIQVLGSEAHMLNRCIKNCSTVNLKNKALIIQSLDKCLRGNKIAPLWHTCLTLLSTCAKGVQFNCPSRTHPAIPYCPIFPFLAHCAFVYVLQMNNSNFIIPYSARGFYFHNGS